MHVVNMHIEIDLLPVLFLNILLHHPSYGFVVIWY